MYLSTLRITNFRNFTDQRVDLAPGGIAIIGDNGQGKTNFLEAIYYLEIFRSFRGAPDEQLTRFGQDVFRIEGGVEGDGPARSVSAAFDRRRRKKKVTVDGAEPPRLGDAIGRVGVVIFSPSDIALISGGPALRRRFLDVLLSLTEPTYLTELQRYRQILLQRNALLRSGAGEASVAAWNEGLVRSGARVTLARQRWIEARRVSFADHAREIAGGTEAAIEYEPSVPVEPGEIPPADVIEERFNTGLTRLADRERRYGTSLVGPHRDDLRIRATSDGGGEWVDLRSYGSGGQQRTAAISLRMVEGETLRDRLGSDPLILLDDVFAELDAGRSRRILDWVDAGTHSQVILTAPKPADFAIRGDPLQLWRISNGVISRE
ncbi:MAG: DNA replication/repair protein RecF [Gemmatimonadota bacterium]|jgi:DNA replication and repair protein RecF|nr:DNA replication/repair protein RecF [Gemmatimonadota bacterium]